ncbi:MAG: leucine-rich repeat domain-containing protein [Phocaeicola sp.]|nr:leucine-rich repeat domain-containing protein [Phocaeicola sp.]
MYDDYFDFSDNSFKRNGAIFILEASGTVLVGVNDKNIIKSTIPNIVKYIGNYAFSGCTSLTSINLPDNVECIGNYAFYGCTNLRYINIPENVITIESCAFDSCESLTSIDIPNSVTTIENSAFYGCTNLKYINIPNSVTTIGENVFSGCDVLTSINIPNSVTSIGYSAFAGCKSLRSIHSAIEEIDNVEIEEDAFDGIDLDECTLFVPPGTRWAYRHHPVFGKFKNIEIETKGKE